MVRRGGIVKQSIAEARKVVVNAAARGGEVNPVLVAAEKAARSEVAKQSACLVAYGSVQDGEKFLLGENRWDGKESPSSRSGFGLAYASSFVEGIPFVVKDNLLTHQFPTSAGSMMLNGYHHRYDAAVVSRLINKGAILMGKTRMDEFGMGSFGLCRVSESMGSSVGCDDVDGAKNGTLEWASMGNDNVENNQDEVKIRNPLDLSRSAGGSSGGSAAAVACGAALFALGSDTGGSVRQPAANCGLVGLKPTYGLLPRDGLISYASSLDTIGVITNTVNDAFGVLHVIQGTSKRDMTSSNRNHNNDNYSTQGLDGLRIGVPIEARIEGAKLSSTMTNAWAEAEKILRDRGATVCKISIPMFSKGLAAYHIIAQSEAASNLSRYDGIQYGPIGVNVDGDDVDKGILKQDSMTIESQVTSLRSVCFGDEVKRRIILGTFATSGKQSDGWYVHAARIRSKLVSDFHSCFQNDRFDALITPTMLNIAPKFSEISTMSPEEVYFGDVFTVPANMAGLPAISVPAGVDPSSGMPRSIQIITSWYREDVLQTVAAAVEKDFAQTST